MKKILLVSTVSRQFYLFEKGNIEELKKLGYEVHTAANFNDKNERLDSLNIIRHPIDIKRSPFSLTNIKAYLQLKKIMKTEKFDAVHCHSPMGGVLARLAAKRTNVPKIIYTAHGFHFFKGAPKINWLLYFPIEKWLSKYTDILLVINQEDYNIAKKFKSQRVEYIPGIGIDNEKFKLNKKIRAEKLKDLGISEDSFVILSVGELNKNKNHKLIIEALAQIKNKEIEYIICGEGTYYKDLIKLAIELNVSHQVKLLGYRNDVDEIVMASDLFIFPSFREGLSVSLMEAMAAGLPVICSKIRGNTDLVMEGKGGYLLSPKEVMLFANKIEELLMNKELRNKMGLFNETQINKFDKRIVSEKMKKIYNSIEFQ